MKRWTILTHVVRAEVDVVLARQRARQVAELLRLDGVTQTRIATAVSEIARNAFRYAGGGRVEFLVEGAPEPVYVVRVSDQGAGIERLPERVAADGGIGTGESAGLAVARRLVDRFEVDSSPGGTTIELGVAFPAERAGFTPEELAEVTRELARRPPQSLLEQMHQQNQELLGVLENLMRRQAELARLNEELEETNRGVLALYSEVARELEDTNRGVLALYAELDDRAEELRRVNFLQGQFFSYMSHEFRTPLHSTVALSNLLLRGQEPPLTADQQTQVRLIRQSTTELMDLVGDLLDLARFEAGKLDIQVEEFTVAELFSALRGMFRPLVPSERVALVFEEDEALPALRTDQRKIAQILRNLVSNALKFTERGEVRVAAGLADGGSAIRFSVADTGIGIAPADLERIFEDFEQATNPFQRRVPGSGLGLPLSRRLARLLGGGMSVESTVDAGSRFTLVVPLVHPGRDGAEWPRPGPGAAAS